MAAVLGFEPRQTESESAVLPLHNTALPAGSNKLFEPNNDYYIRNKSIVKHFFRKFQNSESFTACCTGIIFSPVFPRYFLLPV